MTTHPIEFDMYYSLWLFRDRRAPAVPSRRSPSAGRIGRLEGP